MKKQLSALAAILVTALPAQAQYPISTGGYAEKAEVNYLPGNGADLANLLRGCEDKSCMSYVSGVINGIGVYAHLTNNKSPFCAGESVDSADIRDAIISVVEDTPRLGNIPAPAAVLAAFSRNWPCVDNAAEAVTGDMDDVNETGDLITYAELPQVDIDALLDFVSKDTSLMTYGDMDAPLEKTLHVFDDPNCEYCNIFKEELEQLAMKGWKIIVYPVSVISEESKGYIALQYALADEAPDLVKELYLLDAEGTKDTSTAMSVAQEAGVNMSVVLDAFATTQPYAKIETNNDAFRDLGAFGTPAWILGDRISAGILDADEIIRIQETMDATPARGLIRPGVTEE